MRIVYLTRKYDQGSKTALADTENNDPIFILNKCGLVFNFWDILKGEGFIRSEEEPECSETF